MMKELQSDERRRVILGSLQGIGVALASSLAWSAFVSENAKASLLLRPPGAKPEKEFLRSCIRCGLCVNACPFETLKLASAGSGLPLGTPYFVPRSTPCYMCEDIPCVPACPSGALESDLVSTLVEGKKTPRDQKRLRWEWRWSIRITVSPFGEFSVMLAIVPVHYWMRRSRLNTSAMIERVNTPFCSL